MVDQSKPGLTMTATTAAIACVCVCVRASVETVPLAEYRCMDVYMM